MASRNYSVLIRYQTEPNPRIIAYLVKKEKKTEYQIVSSIEHPIESYQIENGILKDYQVIADKLLHGLEEISKAEDTVSLIYDSKSLLRFNTVLPRSSLSKAKKLAKKELKDFFQSNIENYHVTTRIINAKDKGIIFYYDLMNKNIVKSVEKVVNAMDHYVDSHTNLTQIVAGLYESKVEDEVDTFLVYQDTYQTHVSLLFKSLLVDSIRLNEKSTVDEIISSIELLRNKHCFAFEKRETNQVVLMLEDNSQDKESYIDGLKQKEFDVSECMLSKDELVIFAVKKIDDYTQGYFTKL